VLKAILKNDEDILTNPQKPIDSKPEVVRRPSREFQWQIGFLREDLSPESQYDFLVRSITRFIEIHDDSFSLQAYRPTTYFCSAVSLWDFLPHRNTASTQRVIALLRGALELAESLEKNNLCIYSFTRTFGEMMPAGEFIRHINKSLQMIKNHIGGNLSNLDDREINKRDQNGSSLLMTLNF
jgi:hypothetical protein